MSSVVPLRSSSCQSPDLVLPRPFPSVLTTRAFDHSRRRWFGTCSCQPVPRGPPSSIKQLHTLGPPRPFALVAHSRPRSSLFSPGTAPHVWSASTPSTSGSYRGSPAEDRSRPLVECRDRYPCRPLASSSPSHPVPQPALSTTSSPDAACACRRSSEPRTASARNVNGVKVFRQIRVNDIRVAFVQQLIHCLNRILRTSLRPVRVSIRLQVRLKDRFQYQFCGGLRHPVPYCRDTQRAFSSARIRNHYSPHRLWLIRLLVQVFPQAVQPPHQPPRLDVLEAFSVHARSAMVGL